MAARAGVSIATVSRAFTSPDKVRGPTRKRIEEAANELGYIRNLAAGSLHNRFSGTIGLVVPTIDNAIFSELIEAFSAQLLSHDRIMLIAAHGYDLKLEVALIRSLLERRIDGLALVGFDHDPVSLNMLAQRNVPVIEVWNHRQGAPLPCVGADNKAAAADHAEHLGHEFPERIDIGTTKFVDARGRLAQRTFDGSLRDVVDVDGLTATGQYIYDDFSTQKISDLQTFRSLWEIRLGLDIRFN